MLALEPTRASSKINTPTREHGGGASRIFTESSALRDQRQTPDTGKRPLPYTAEHPLGMSLKLCGGNPVVGVAVVRVQPNPKSRQKAADRVSYFQDTADWGRGCHFQPIKTRGLSVDHYFTTKPFGDLGDVTKYGLNLSLQSAALQQPAGYTVVNQIGPRHSRVQVGDPLAEGDAGLSEV